MLSIVFGLISLSLGFWVMVKYWWYMVDVLVAMLPLLLIFGGAVALLAGIRNTGMRSSFKIKTGVDKGLQAAPRKKDE